MISYECWFSVTDYEIFMYKINPILNNFPKAIIQKHQSEYGIEINRGLIKTDIEAHICWVKPSNMPC